MTILTKPSYVPKCPNHGVSLEGCGFPLPNSGTGTCPVSGAEFEFDARVDESIVTQDKNGELTKGSKWEVKGDD